MINSILINELDKTEVNSSKVIDTIIASCWEIEYVKGYTLLEYNEIVLSDYRSCLIDVNLEGYFDEQFSLWDQINKVILNPVQRSHHEKFVEIIEKQLDMYQLEREISSIQNILNHEDIEWIDRAISLIWNVATKKIEVTKCNILFSKEKQKRKLILVY